MQKRNGRLTLAASDLGRFLCCRHLSALDIEVVESRRKKPPVYPDPILELLIQRGLEHEKKYTEKVEAAGSPVLDLSAYKDNPADAFARTVAAMKAGQPAIAQAALAADGWFGMPDLLRKIDRRSKLGSWSYEAYDTKLARETRGTTILQLSFYSELLEGAQGIRPERFYVVTPIATEDYRVADYAAYYRFVKRNLQGVVGQDTAELLKENYPEPVDHCSVCRWSQQCDKRRRADDHLSLIAGITRLQRRELEAHEIKTLERFGDLGLPLPFKPLRGSTESLEKAQNQARVQLEGRHKNAPIHELLKPVEEGRGLSLLPEPSPGDAFLDLEGDHFAAEGGREYLFGMTVIGLKNQSSHRKVWAHTETDEKAAFEAILDEIKRLRAKNPRMHVYHYAPYEPSAFKRLMGRHAVREQDVDEMLRAGLFVDLCAVVKQGLRASVESYSIKDMERFYGFVRKTPLRNAGSARRAVEFSLEMDDLGAITPEIRALVENYNEEDCVSALELRNWLESLRLEHEKNGIQVPRPPLKDGKASEETAQRSAEVQAAMTKLLDGVPPEKKDRSEAQQARWLLANMLEFHRREDKVAWWEFFRLCGLVDEDDLLAERAVVTGLQFVNRTPPAGRGKVPTDRYRFPPQEFSGREGNELKTQDRVKWGTIADIDVGARWVDVTKTIARKDENPRTAFVHTQIRAEPIPSALMRLAQDVIEHGVDSPKRKSAALELLLATPPRLKTGHFIQQEGADTLELATRCVIDLNHSVLPIQGPPGSGKTYRGAWMIAECVRNGLKVGISAVSHKVIKKLLEDAVAAARDLKPKPITLRCIHKDAENQVLGPGIEEVAKSEQALAAIRDGNAHVISGTAWLWARPDAAGMVDVLFVDEAGQASLANVLAMAQAAKSLVLLGDPQQLEQPQRGTHPEGVDASALEHLLKGNKTISADRGIFLDKTRRLPPSICDFTSELFYEGRLEPLPELNRQKLSGAQPYEGAGLWFVPADHDGNTNSSPEEVKIVEALVAKLLRKGSSWTNHQDKTRQMTAEDILVVAPFNAQVDLLYDALESSGIRVGTVDRFQGQEAAVVIYSMATSRPEDAPRGMEFLYDINRLNVATSRARCACILVASPRLLEPECRTPKQMRLANALCRYIEMAHSYDPATPE